ncbi:LysR family transcriptional regulator [Streptomyces sp. 3N207]|uniref:LysR family transcriptional regulator n=1 Tax=Streptomyces sp. 3N207 TaxID=3457417 RepID=UPI003FD50BA4
MIDLRRLHVLRAVAHHGTVTAAARAMHVTASAASHQIRQLGRDLDVTLLEPQGRGVRLTAAARELLLHAEEMEERWERAYAALHSGAEPSGALRLCGISTAVAALIAPAARALRDRCPALDVHVREAEPAEGFDLLLSGATDLALIEPTPDTPRLDDPRFAQEALLTDPFDLLVPNGHPLAGRTQAVPGTTLGDAAHEPWIVEMEHSSSRYYTLAACTSAGFSPYLAHEARHWSVVAALVAEGLGIALVPRLAQLPPLAVTRVELRGRPAPARTLLGAIRRGSTDRPGIAAALAALRAVDVPASIPGLAPGAEPAP